MLYYIMFYCTVLNIIVYYCLLCYIILCYIVLYSPETLLIPIMLRLVPRTTWRNWSPGRDASYQWAHSIFGKRFQASVRTIGTRNPQCFLLWHLPTVEYFVHRRNGKIPFRIETEDGVWTLHGYDIERTKLVLQIDWRCVFERTRERHTAPASRHRVQHVRWRRNWSEA